jgi:hypothetical protein
VEQQPVRARMCGFGDKDRRPITPPPCVRLIITDAASGAEVDYNEIDSTFFVLTVDLWDQNKGSEVNLVRQNSGTPTVSISTSSTASYPPQVERQHYLIPNPAPMMPGPQYGGGGMAPHHHPQPSYHHPHPNPNVASYYHPQQQQPPPPPPPPPQLSHPQYGYHPPPPPGYMVAPPTAPPAGMFTRNLIGSLCVNAFRLTDTEGKVGFWFVLQDLSVRTEGFFR